MKIKTTIWLWLLLVLEMCSGVSSSSTKDENNGITLAHIEGVQQNVSLRAEANTKAEVICTIDKGEEVEVLGQRDDGWSEVSYNSQTGFVKSQYLQLEEKKSNGDTALSTSFFDRLPTWLRYVLYFIAGMIGLFLLGLFVKVIGAILGGALLAGAIGLIFGGTDAGYNALPIGAVIGGVIGIIYVLRNPADAATGGINDLAQLFGSSSSSDSSYSPPADDEEYNTVIRGAGMLGRDVKAKEYWDGTIRGENGKWYERNDDGTVSEKK